MTTRKTILIISVLSFFAIATTAYAQGFVPLAEIPGLTSPDVTSIIPSQGFAAFFNNLYKYCIGLSAVLAVIMIVWGGLEISTQDSISKQGAGRERITQAIYGLVLVLSPVLVFSIINPAILNLSLNMLPLDLTYTPYQPIQTVVTPYVQLPGTTRPGSLSAANNGTCIAFQDGGYTSPQPCAYCYQLKTSLSTNDPLNLNQGSVANYICAKNSNGCRLLSNDLPAVDNLTCNTQVPAP